MDQAHQIHGSAIAVVRVPYVCNDRFTFDGGDFYSYPYRCGVAENPDARSLGALNLQDKSIDDLAPFLQAWLFFGTLHTLFNGLINSNLQWVDFVEKAEDGKVFVTTKMLPMYIWCWAAYESAVPVDANYGASVVTSLVQTIDIILASLVEDDKKRRGAFAPCFDTVERSQSPGHCVLLSIIAFCEMISIAGQEIYAAQSDGYKPRFISLLPSILTQRLQSAGWCPWQIEYLEEDSNMGCLTAYMLSMIDQTRLSKDHTSCSTKKCYGYDVNYDTYKSKHSSPSCNCTFLPRTDEDVTLRISRVLDDGDIPLLSLSDSGEDSDASINVKFYSPADKEHIPQYVAISHVWSDGLGNQERNAMPLCILRMIQQRVNAVYEDGQEPVLFWVDTICVPTTNKIPALEAMLQTYQNADTVLVLDASLDCVSEQVSPQEMLLRIRTSPWMQRLWTLQEAWVANDLAFQFLEAAYRGETLLENCIRVHSPLKLSIEQLLYPQKRGTNKKLSLFITKLIRALAVDYNTFDMPKDKMVTLRRQLEANIPGYPKEEDHRLARLVNRSHAFDPVFRDAWTPLLSLLENRGTGGSFHIQDQSLIFNALKNRQTSRQEDEMYCIANLMKLPVLPILMVEPEQRMKKLLTLMPKVPATVIFSHQFMRLEDEGFSWAPKTFMSIHAISYTSSTMGRVEGKGLNVSLPGLEIRRPRANHTDAITDVLDVPEQTQVSKIKVAMPLQSEKWLYTLEIFNPPGHPPANWCDYDGMELMVIVRKTSPDAHGRIIDTMDAALVSLMTQDNHVRTVKFITVLWMQRTSQKLTTESAQGCYEGQWLDDERSWCIL